MLLARPCRHRRHSMGLMACRRSPSARSATPTRQPLAVFMDLGKKPAQSRAGFSAALAAVSCRRLLLTFGLKTSTAARSWLVVSLLPAVGLTLTAFLPVTIGQSSSISTKQLKKLTLLPLRAIVNRACEVMLFGA